MPSSRFSITVDVSPDDKANMLLYACKVQMTGRVGHYFNGLRRRLASCKVPSISSLQKVMKMREERDRKRNGCRARASPENYAAR